MPFARAQRLAITVPPRGDFVVSDISLLSYFRAASTPRRQVGYPFPVMQPAGLATWASKDGERNPLFTVHPDRPDHFGTFSEHGSESLETMSAQSIEMHRNALTRDDLIGTGDMNASFDEMRHTLLERWCPAGGFWSGVVGILTSAVTPSVLSLPLAVGAAGIPFAGTAMAVCIAMTLVSVRYIAMAAVCANESDYSFVVAYFLGTTARSLVLNILLFYNFGCAVVNLRFILENFYSLFVHNGVLGAQAWPLAFIGLCGVCVCLLPLMFRSRISSLKTAGFFSNFAVLCIAGVVVYEYFMRRSDAGGEVSASYDTNNIGASSTSPSLQSSVVSLRTFLFVAPIYIFSFEVQSNVLAVIDDLHSPTPNQIWAIVATAMGIATFLYMTIGAFGALSFPNAPIDGNVLKSYPVQDLPLVFSQILCIFSSAVTFLFTMFPCRYAIHSAIWSKGRIPASRRAQISLFLCVSGCLTALLVPDVAVAVSWLGALCSSTISMTIPALLAFQMRSTSAMCQGWFEAPLAGLLLVAGVLTAVLGTTMPLWAPEL